MITTASGAAERRAIASWAGKHLVEVAAVVQAGQRVDGGLLAQRLLQRLHLRHLVRKLAR